MHTVNFGKTVDSLRQMESAWFTRRVLIQKPGQEPRLNRSHSAYAVRHKETPLQITRMLSNPDHFLVHDTENRTVYTAY